MGFLTIFYKYIIQQYFTVTAPTAFTKYLKQIKYKMLVLVHPQRDKKREATMGFLTIFYKYIIQQYFTLTAPTAFTKYLKQIKYKMLVLVHPQRDKKREATMGFLTIFYKYDTIQQYFTVTAPTAFAKYLKQIKYKMLALVHPQSAENVRLRWGF